MRTRSLKPTSQYFILLKGKNSFAGMTLFHSLHCSEFLISMSVLINCPIIFCFDMLGKMNRTKIEKMHRQVIYILQISGSFYYDISSKICFSKFKRIIKSNSPIQYVILWHMSCYNATSCHLQSLSMSSSFDDFEYRHLK